MGRRILITGLLGLLTAAVIRLTFSADWSALAPLTALADGESWATPTVVSAPPGFSWFPDLAVDPFGTVHVVWCLTIPLGGRRGLQEQVNYAHWNGESWSAPNDIVPPSADIVRNAVAADLAGNLHLLFGGSVYNHNFALYYQKASVGEAWAAGNWSAPHRINQGGGYMGDIAVDSQGVIHVIYDDLVIHVDEEDELILSDIFYRRSADGGRTWSYPVSLYPEPLTGSARSTIEIDSQDVIHVTWDEGWDRLVSGGTADTYHGVYVSSSDGGESWSSPTVVDYPDALVVQLTVGSDGTGGVMLVWRTIASDTSQPSDELFYQWSTDGGASWGEPSVIPQIFARAWTHPFDMYDMATDSAGHIHLLVAGRRSPEGGTLLGTYHLVWDGEKWSIPTRVFAVEGLYPEYPKITVHEGNQLHAAWFTREGSVWDQDVERVIWYASGQSPAPHQPVTPQPTSTPNLPTPTPAPSPPPTSTPYPTISIENAGLPNGLYTEGDDVFRLVLALSPVVLVVLVVAAIRMGWFRRLGR